MKCPNCNAIIPDTEDICPACFAPVQTTQEPLAPPCTSAPVRHPREVENQSETSWKTREGQQCTPLRENTVRGNVEGRFSRTSSKKGLFIAAGVLVLLIIAGTGYMVLGNRQAPIPPVAKEQPAPEEPAEQTQAPAKEEPAEEKPAEVKQAPDPVQKKTVKKVPKVQAPAPAPAPTPKWTYRPDPQVKPVPAPAPQASKKSGIAGWLDKTLGPEVPVTPPPPPNDARNGM